MNREQRKRLLALQLRLRDALGRVPDPPGHGASTAAVRELLDASITGELVRDAARRVIDTTTSRYPEWASDGHDTDLEISEFKVDKLERHLVKIGCGPRGQQED
jgi:hypothetical protein